jgi:hypothetical protein
MRGQLAGESKCIRRIGTISTVVGQREYNFSNIAYAEPAINGTLSVRRAYYAVGSGYKWITPRPWEWFDLYGLSNPVPPSGPPRMWAQLKQGSSGTGVSPSPGFPPTQVSSGTFWIDPLPDLTYTLNLDCECYPVPLQVEADAEAIPYEWTDAVPFGAAWMALLGAQTSARMAEAQLSKHMCSEPALHPIPMS